MNIFFNILIECPQIPYGVLTVALRLLRPNMSGLAMTLPPALALSLRGRSPRQSHVSSNKSFHPLFISSINFIFFALEPPFICFSLAIALFMSS